MKHKISKSKMLRATLQSRYSLNIIILIQFLLCSFMLGAQEFSKSSSSGIITSLVNEINKDRQTLNLLKKEQKSQSTTILDKESIDQFKISATQFSSFLLFTPSRYLKWINGDQCKFYALLENGLIQDAQGPVNKIIFIDNKNNKPIYIGVKRFIRLMYKKQCLKNRTLQKLFQSNSLRQTIKRLDLTEPKTLKECRSKLLSLNSLDYLPYLCGIINQDKQYAKLIHIKHSLEKQDKLVPYKLLNRIKEIKQIRKHLTKFQHSDLQQFCSNFDNETQYCNNQLHTDFWQAIQSGKQPEYEISYICKTLFPPSPKLSTDQISRCITVLKKSPEVCLTANYHSTPALLPHPNCKILAKNLENSRLYTNYKDCPALIGNTYITNIARIIKHFTKPKISNGSCSDSAYQELATLFHKFDPHKKLGTKICFKHPIKQQKKCFSFIPGASQKLKNSESRVLSRVLYELKGIPLSTTCRFVTLNKFNPHLLEYKNGCVVTYKNKNCTNYGCPKMVYYNSMRIKGIKYQGQLLLDYRPSFFSHSLYALNKQIKKVYKIKEKIIHNLTEAKFFLQLNNQNIIHGVGCAEDIYPQRFPRRTLNQCRILPFIIDGMRQVKNQTLFITRTAIDDVHSPKTFNWTVIYSAIKSFQLIHPLEGWSLYGLRK